MNNLTASLERERGGKAHSLRGFSGFSFMMLIGALVSWMSMAIVRSRIGLMQAYRNAIGMCMERGLDWQIEVARSRGIFIKEVGIANM